jgi:DNA repair exonuclease SbcCD nuclease subunit
MIRFLHVADFHLGLRITRFDEDACGRMAEARFTALRKVRTEAARLNVDFILVAGDVFDDHTVSKSDATRAFPILESSADACPIYVIPGNHDPLVPGGVWDRDPWLREQPHLRVRFLRNAEPVDVPNRPVTIYPCPLKQRRSMDDPTAWIARHAREGNDRFRIGLAHGSLSVGFRLPDDDHLIRPDAADAYGLDYLALGHWHKEFRHKSADGIVRTAYSGVHEPMGFPGGLAALATGWASFSADGDAERFHDDGVGRALLVTIPEPGAPPVIETVEVGELRWSAEQRELTGVRIGSLISEYADREHRSLTVLRLALSGVIDPQSYERLEELRSVLLKSYHSGTSIDDGGVVVEPDADKLAEAVGQGVLQKVLGRLQNDAASADPNAKCVADHALKLLYKIVWEGKPA